MINKYEIRKINNEEILYLYIDDNYEFAKINKGEKRKSFLENVSHFLNKNEIKFAGSTIAIVAGGLVIGNLFLNKTDDINLKNSIINIQLNPQFVQTEVLEEDFTENTNINDTLEDIEVKFDENISVEDNNKSKEIVKDTIKNEIKEDTINISEEKEIKNKEIVTVFRDNGEILNLELENYLINVVAAEMPASFNIEALKAQSVLARTYAKKAIKSGKVLTDTTSTQVYHDDNELKNLWGKDYNKYYEKIKKAVMETAGEVLKYDGKYIEAVYHSTSNGYTEDSQNVWGNSFPYLKVVESNLDKNVKNYEVTTFFSYDKLSDLLNFNVDNSTKFDILERNQSNRVSKVSINNNEYSGIILRGILGLRSADFEFHQLEDGINIITKGYGHGVGMSQYGANEMAKNGLSYKNILNHYYQGCKLVLE